MKTSATFPRVALGEASESLISSAGGSLLVQTARVTGLDAGLSRALSPWRRPHAVHDPGKIVADLAVAVALGGDCLADVALVRAQPQLFGPVASDPTVSRLVDTLAGDVEAAVTAIRGVRAAARAKAWAARRPVAGRQAVIDLDATLITAHTEKQGATPTFKRGFGFHPLLAFADHGAGGTGEPLAAVLRPGKATPNDAAAHITVLGAALDQLPAAERRSVLVRGDTGAGVRAFLHNVTDLGLQDSVGFYIHQPVLDALAALPRSAWRAALDANGRPREGAQVAELTAHLPATLVGWPAGMRV